MTGIYDAEGKGDREENGDGLVFNRNESSLDIFLYKSLGRYPMVLAIGWMRSYWDA